MNSAIEQGLKNFLAAKLDAEDVALGEGDERIEFVGALVAGVRTSLHCYISNDVTPELLPWIICVVRDLPHATGGKLYVAACSYVISTPQNIDGITEDTHRAIVAAVGALLKNQAGNSADLSAAVLAAANCTADSWHLETFRNSIAKTRWQTEIPFKLCVLDQS